jgi:23S rRNA pseudouridine1911/1915/1917 synthase
MDIPIIYEDEHIVGVNKPAGLVVHGDGKMQEATLADWVLERYPSTREVGEPLVLSSGEKIVRPGIVHRLDKDTSGVLVIAKDQETFLHLKKAFQDRTMEKIYRTVVYGEIKNDAGSIDVPIGRSPSDFRKRLAGDRARGTLREAHTDYKVLLRGRGCTYVEVYPKTGRTHQIRVHFKALEHPVICDSLYAPKREGMLGFTRLALHAWRLSLNHPDGHRMILEAPLPADFERAITLMEGK